MMCVNCEWGENKKHEWKKHYTAAALGLRISKKA